MRLRLMNDLNHPFERSARPTRKATAARMSVNAADIVRVYIDEEPGRGDDGRGIAGQGNTSYKSLAITFSLLFFRIVSCKKLRLVKIVLLI